MANLKVLSESEFEYLNSKYNFTLVENNISVSTKGIRRNVLHSIDEGFSINTKIRRVSITKEAINFWIYKFKEKYTLLEVQNAISILKVTYQKVNEETIEKQIERGNAKIKVI